VVVSDDVGALLRLCRNCSEAEDGGEQNWDQQSRAKFRARQADFPILSAIQY
jgi:hypothetical protein